MKRFRVTIIDLVTRGPESRPFSRVMNANYASVMPQAIAVWCEELGHDVTYICFTGNEDVTGELARETDILIIGAFTVSAFFAYTLSAIYQKNGAVTVLGGPHARCYPEDSARFFDYVLGFTDKPLIDNLLSAAAPERPTGAQLNAPAQPVNLPGVRARWKFIGATLEKAPFIKLVPMIGSFGCPYSCDFCIDASVKYQPLPFDEISEDLRFVRKNMKKPMVGWHDPNFGIRFNDYMGAMEEAVPPGSIQSVAESSLSILTKPNLARLERNGFVGMLPGIESWSAYGNKSKSSRVQGEEKMRQTADQINAVLDHIPFVQTNFILGLDCDEGVEPFELTKQFLKLAPGAYPAFSLLTAYGRAATMNLELQRAGRVFPTPFQFLDSNHATNVRPLNYDWREFYKLTADLTRFTLSLPRTIKRFYANRGRTTKLLNAYRALSSNRASYHANMARMMASDTPLRRFADGETRDLPDFYMDGIRKSLGPLWPAFPKEALQHDELAYLKSEDGGVSSDPLKVSAE